MFQDNNNNNNNNNNSKWSKNFEERPHRRFVTPLRMDSSDLDPIQCMVIWAHKSQLPNGISIGSTATVFFSAHERDQRTDRQTDRQTNRQTNKQTDRQIDHATSSARFRLTWCVARSVCDSWTFVVFGYFSLFFSVCGR